MSGLCRTPAQSEGRRKSIRQPTTINCKHRTPSLLRGEVSVRATFGGPELTTSIKTTAVFLQPFRLASFNETLPAGEYEIETDPLEPADWIEPSAWTASVIVRLHPRVSHPGLSRTLTVPLSELERAVAKDKLTGKALTDFFLDEMLADPMVRLVMQADGVAEAEIRGLYAHRTGERTACDRKWNRPIANSGDDDADGQKPPRMTWRQGIGE